MKQKSSYMDLEMMKFKCNNSRKEIQADLDNDVFKNQTNSDKILEYLDKP